MKAGIPSESVQIAPSMMCADPFGLADTVAVMDAAGIEWMHIDVMDGRHVPNFALSPDHCRWLAHRSSIPLDVHLMTEDPDRFIGAFASFPGVRITFHPETVRQPVRVVERIRELGASPGIALDPSMSLSACEHLLPLVDQVLIMTVSPGYAGQKLLPFCLPKITACRSMLNDCGSQAAIEVDGNVSWDNIPRMIEAGADILVAGTSSLFVDGRITSEAIAKMRALADEAIGARPA